MSNLSIYFEEFLFEKRATGVSDATITSYSQSYSRLSKFLGDSELNKNSFLLFINYLQEEGLSNASVRHYIREMKVFLYWCMEKHYIQPFVIQPPKEIEGKLRCFSADEAKALLKKPNNRNFVDWRNWCVSNLVCGTGIRANSICNMKVSDLDFGNKQINVNVTKNKRVLVVPMTPSLEAVLSLYLKVFKVDYWLFPSVKGEQMTTNALKLSFSKYCKRKGLDTHNIHAMRHFFASEAVRNGMNPFVLKQLMGHSSLNTTMRYVHLANSNLGVEQNPLENINKRRQ